MIKNLAANILRGRKCVYCGRYGMYRLADKRVKCKNCKGVYSIKKLKRDLEVLHYFCLELSARKAANDLGLSYNTVSKRYKSFREQIANYCDVVSGKFKGEIELDETYFGGKRKGKRGRGAFDKAIALGILERNGKVHVKVVPDVSAKTLMSGITKKADKGAVFYTDRFKSYKSLKHYGNNQNCKTVLAHKIAKRF